MTDHECDSEARWKEYSDTLAQMSKDLGRSPRKREVESVFGQALPTVLAELRDNTDSKSEMLRRINSTLDANGIEENVSRSTLYDWLSQLDDGE